MLPNSRYSLAFVTECLSKATGRTLDGVAETRSFAEGNGNCSSIIRVVYENGESFVAKLPTIERLATFMAGGSQMSAQELKERLAKVAVLIPLLHERELEFYELAQRLPGMSGEEARIPAFYYGEKMDDEHEGIILMEDLTRRGADVVDVARGLSEEQFLSCVDALVQWHIASLREKDLPFFEPIPEQLVQKTSTRFLDQFLSQNHPWVTEEVKRLLKRCMDSTHLREIYTQTTDSKVDHVICHGDFWPNNLLFVGDELAAAVDWQGFFSGVYTTNFAGLLAVGLDPEVRRTCTERTARHYFDAMIAHRSEFVRPFEATFEDMRKSLRRSMDWGLVQLLMTAGYQQAKDVPREGETEGPLTRRLRCYIEDMLALE